MERAACVLHPRALATAPDLEEKRRAYAEFCATTHWPSRLVRAFPVLGEEGYFVNNPSPSVRFWGERMQDGAARQQASSLRKPLAPPHPGAMPPLRPSPPLSSFIKPRCPHTKF